MGALNKKDSVDVWLGTDTQGNPITDSYMFKGDARYTEKSEDIARRYNWNMMNYLNWWNSPELQVSRLEEAGLNPLFYLGGNAGTLPAGAGGSLTGHLMSSADGRLGLILEASQNTADTLLGTQKQALDYDIARRQQDIDLDKLDIERAKVAVDQKRYGLEANRLEQDIQESQSRMRVNDAEIERKGKENQWTDQQIAESKAQIAVLNKELDRISAVVSNLDADTKLKKVEAWLISKLVPELVDNLRSLTGLNKALVRTEILKMYNFLMDTHLKSVEIDVGKGLRVLIERLD